MGTNYYLEGPTQEPCACCHRPYEQERLHIGKSSAGWVFALHVTPEITSLEDWRKAWSRDGWRIVNEYKDPVHPDDMLQMVTRRQGSGRGFSRDAVRGPNGLLRNRIDGRHCIGHGEGTWDLITGEFC